MSAVATAAERAEPILQLRGIGRRFGGVVAVADVQTFARIPEVDQTFGGFFSPETPAPDRENPKCEKGEAPSWVGNAEEVSFGG